MKIPSLKTFFCLAVAGAFSLLYPTALHAADDAKKAECSMTAGGKLLGPDGKPMGDCMMMKDGKMHTYHNGSASGCGTP